VSSVGFLLDPFYRRDRAGWSIPQRRDTSASVNPPRAGALDLFYERAQLAILAVEVDPAWYSPWSPICETRTLSWVKTFLTAVNPATMD